MPGPEQRVPVEGWITLDKAKELLADAGQNFDKLKAAVADKAPTRAVVVSPLTADPAAGWFATNLAATLAQVRHRVLVIDADPSDRPRHPLLAQKGDGLAEVLAQTVSLQDAVVSSDVPGV